MKKVVIASITVGTLLIGAAATTTSVLNADAQTKVSKSEAQKIALAKVGNGQVIKSSYDQEDREYEFDIVTTAYKYEVTVDAKTGKVIEIEKEKRSTSKISAAKAKAIALNKVKGSTFVAIEKDDDEYEITLRKGNYKYEVTVDAKTSKVIEVEKEKVATVKVSKATAKATALKKVPGGTILSSEYEDGVYSFDILKGSYKYEVNVRAKTGKVIEIEKEKVTSKTAKISLAEAQKIAYKKTNNATLTDVAFEKNAYEFELKDKFYEYEVTVDAKTGKVTAFEKEKK